MNTKQILFTLCLLAGASAHEAQGMKRKLETPSDSEKSRKITFDETPVVPPVEPEETGSIPRVPEFAELPFVQEDQQPVARQLLFNETPVRQDEKQPVKRKLSFGEAPVKQDEKQRTVRRLLTEETRTLSSVKITSPENPIVLKDDTPEFISACLGKNLLAVQKYIEDKAAVVDVKYTDAKGWTALHAAGVLGDWQVIQWLRDRGADINRQTMKRGSVKFQACLHGHKKIAQLLKFHHAERLSSEEWHQISREMRDYLRTINKTDWTLGGRGLYFPR